MLIAATPMVTRNGASRQTTMTTSRTATTASTIQPASPTGPAGAIASSVLAMASGSGATSLAALPSRCGQPLMPVARSSARSGTTFARCAPTPSRAVAATAHRGAQGWSGGVPSVTKDGNSPNATAYGSQEIAVDFSPRLYVRATATVTRCPTPASRPLASDSGT